jgi:hypothetical protein
MAGVPQGGVVSTLELIGLLTLYGLLVAGLIFVFIAEDGYGDKDSWL